ncbi:MAG: glycoside hydrolase family 13 protein [Lewinellaceae bacterium]|nr:glycoside hydrolase family 13 protein [Lewinellaceae bacterium]
MNCKSFWLASLLALTGLFHQNIASAAPLERVEPAFWWVGMQNPELQLLVYGENIGNTLPEITYPGVRIERTTRVESPNYLFIDLRILNNQDPASFDILFKIGNQVQTTYRYELRPRKKGSAQRQGFSPADVLYLVTPDRFVNGDPKNDAVPGLAEKPNRQNPGGRHGGDIAGLIKSLDYIENMGFTAIWLNPVLENNQESYSYHGYSATDFYAVDSRFGSNADYVRLSELAHQKGIKMIMDMIFNHCGSGHWWMKDLPSTDWINFDGKFVPTNHMRTVIQDPYVSKEDTRRFADGWFVETMPDLNQRNPLMATYLIQNSIWWIEVADLDGIRMDTYPYPDKDFMSTWTCRLMEEYPHFNIVGEEWTENPALVAHWQRGKVNANGYTSCLPSLMDFPIQGALVKALNEGNGSYEGWHQLYTMLANDFLYADPAILTVFPDNHDMSRFFTQVKENITLFKLGIAYILTTRGIPQIYYGTEVLMKNPGTTDHGVIRSDFPGGWAGDPVNAMTGAGLTAEQRDVQGFIQKLQLWRKNQPVIHHGKMMHFAPENGVYVYFRYTDQGKVMVVLNKQTTDVDLSLDRFAEVLITPAIGIDALTGKEYKLDKVLRVPAGTPLVLDLK